MNILIVAEYLGDIKNPDTFNSRFLTVADMLRVEGHDVRIVTTDFIHHLKEHTEGVSEYKDCELITLHEPGYKKNVSLKRFFSHYVLSKQLKKWLRNIKKPDVIYCAVPSLDFAYEAARYAEINDIKFVLDIQDLWPEAFEMVFNIPIISKVIFAPLRSKANYIYSVADEIVAVSQTYVDRALKNNKKCKKGQAVFLGTDLSKFDEYKKQCSHFIKNENEIWLTYIGTLGHSYDLKLVMDAMSHLKKEDFYSKLKFVVMGDGPLKEEFEKYAKKKELNISFLGMLAYPEMVSTLCKADIVVNPIKKNSAGTIINKHADYAASGIAVINTQENEEYCELVERYRMGFNCNNGNAADIAEKIAILIKDASLRNTMGKNARSCAVDNFDRRQAYQEILRVINKPFNL